MEEGKLRERSIRVSLVDDDDLVRSSLSALIDGADGFACVGTYANAEDAVEQVPLDPPDVLLMDINLPAMSGIECVVKLRTNLSDMAIIMLTMFEDDDNVFDSLRSGAGGYLLKRTPQAQILAAVRDAHEGGAPMTSSIARKVVQLMEQTATDVAATGEGLASLSPREKEILTQLAQGYRYKEIAENLDIGVETVRSHLGRIYKKLHVTSRTEATAKFLKH